MFGVFTVLYAKPTSPKSYWFWSRRANDLLESHCFEGYELFLRHLSRNVEIETFKTLGLCREKFGIAQATDATATHHLNVLFFCTN